jgi:hypothetical protein
MSHFGNNDILKSIYFAYFHFIMKDGFTVLMNSLCLKTNHNFLFLNNRNG